MLSLLGKLEDQLLISGYLCLVPSHFILSSLQLDPWVSLVLFQSHHVLVWVPQNFIDLSPVLVVILSLKSLALSRIYNHVCSSAFLL
jgi:hypothetical protein